ncbi:Ni/Fe-hydrogenase cytochrome b subunit, partial [Escherichia coli]|nr:Ni/Fe-hydrogenase cytochrome b subunit [Escherichia coli]
MSHDPQPLGGKIISKPVMIFGPLIVICMLLIVKRLVFGLGSVSDLNGGFPWGVWIAFDLLIGTGFACGGWALAWAVYVFNRGQYHPLVRPALLASLFGYSLGGLSITIDVGRYWNLPYFYIPGHFNVNSVLFETAVCMTIYIGVMALEFAPALFERLGWKLSLKRLNKVMF